MTTTKMLKVTVTTIPDQPSLLVDADLEESEIKKIIKRKFGTQPSQNRRNGKPHEWSAKKVEMKKNSDDKFVLKEMIEERNKKIKELEKKNTRYKRMMLELKRELIDRQIKLNYAKFKGFNWEENAPQRFNREIAERMIGELCEKIRIKWMNEKYEEDLEQEENSRSTQ
jgi:hypothetical protein